MSRYKVIRKYLTTYQVCHKESDKFARGSQKSTGHVELRRIA